METEIFTCKYFKFGRNTTGLSQSHLRNFLACSIKYEMGSHQLITVPDYNWITITSNNPLGVV